MNDYTILYFGKLKQERALSEEQLTSALTTPRAVYGMLSQKHGFSIGTDYLKVAVDESFTDWDDSLSNGSVIAFMPPMAGG